MKKGLWNKRMPTLFAFLLLFFSVWITSFLIQKGVIFVGRATPDKTPQNVLISNITDSSFTISFTTYQQTVAAVQVGSPDGQSFLVYDDRNKKSADQKPYFSHYITVSDLKANTQYNFSILSDGETYLDNGKRYNVSTGILISDQPPAQNPITGKALLSDGNPGQDILVELKIDGAQTITSLTKDDGSYVIPTNSIRNNSLSKYFILGQDQELSIDLIKQDSKANIKVLFKDTQPIPPITLQREYDFTKAQEEKGATLASQLKIPTPKISYGDVKILTPKESQSFVDSQPLLRGTAMPNETVKITIQSNPITAIVIADTNGVWTYRPTTPLSSGEHTITIQTTDAFGIAKTVSQKFTVFASGTTVDQSATPSATPAVTNVPSPTTTPLPSPSSAQPSITATPSPIPTVVTLTNTPAPTVVISSAPITNIPITPRAPGNNSSAIMTFVSVLFIFSGSILLFLL